MNAREFLDILHVAERLKDTPRHCTTSKGRTESVAEHSWRISLMALLLRHEFPDLDMDKVMAMCLIHDLGECFTGDIPAFLKTNADREMEDSLLDQWVRSLPAEVSADLTALYREMDAQETMEAKVYKALDKLEAVIQHNESPLSTWADNEYEMNKTYAFDTVVFSDWLMELRKEILADTLAKIDAERVPREKEPDKSAPEKPAPEKSAAAKPAPKKPVAGKSAAAKQRKEQHLRKVEEHLETAREKVKTTRLRSQERQKEVEAHLADVHQKIALRRTDRAQWWSDGELEAPVPAPAVPAPVRKTMEGHENPKQPGDEAKHNRELVASLERDALIAAMEENVPTIQFPENDDKYNVTRKYENKE